LATVVLPHFSGPINTIFNLSFSFTAVGYLISIASFSSSISLYSNIYFYSTNYLFFSISAGFTSSPSLGGSSFGSNYNKSSITFIYFLISSIFFFLLSYFFSKGQNSLPGYLNGKNKGSDCYYVKLSNLFNTSSSSMKFLSKSTE
jgi:hypothetical protein